MELSPFGYNEAIVSEYFPLKKEEALNMGLKWKEDEPEAKYYGAEFKPPQNIEDVNEDICNKILTCEITGKYYKIIPHELKFYKMMKLPIPKKCPEQRHKERMVLKNPRNLWDRKCQKCNINIKTSYSPKKKLKVFCDNCYETEIY